MIADHHRPARPPLNDVTTSSNIVGHPQVGPPDPKRQRIDSTTAAKPVDQ